jgi:deoxyribodipyrimidine photolyase
MARKALNYPAQIVDLKSSRVRAIEAFKNLR